MGQVRGAEDAAIADTAMNVALTAASPLVPVGIAFRGAGWLTGQIASTNAARAFVASELIRLGTIQFSVKTLAGREVSGGAVRAFFASAGTRATGEVLPHVHGNTAGSQWVYLYACYNAQGNFLKWGVTGDMAKRYSKKELAGGRLTEVMAGPRWRMLQEERNLMETQPGPLNRERWAGCRIGQ